jgi:uncharacterized membrane protein
MYGATVIVLMLAPDKFHLVIVLSAMLGCALVAGVFFAFSSFVMKALARISPTEGIAAMQSINITVLNSWFLTLFLGTAICCFLLIVWSLFQWSQKDSELILIGSALYIAGSLMVTGIFNVPRNKMLAKIDALDANAEGLWCNYVVEWTTWNLVRTIASFLAAACFGLVLY